MHLHRVGVAQSVLSGLCFGSLGLFGKSLYAQGVSPGELLTLRFSLAAALLFAYQLMRGLKPWDISLRALASCALLGCAGYALFSFCFFSALTGLSASLTVILLYAYPILVSLGGWLLFGEPVPRHKLLAFPLALAGLVLLVWGDFSVHKPIGLLWGIASAVFYALYILVSARLLRHIPALQSTTYIQAFAGLILSCLFLHDASRAIEIIRSNTFPLLMIVIFGTVLAMSLFLASLQKLKSWEISLLSLTEPVSGVLLACVFLRETLSVVQVIGAIAVLSSLVYIAKPQYKVSA